MIQKTIGVYGDSIAAGFWDEDNKGGWVVRLQKLCGAAYGISNHAVSGARSVDVLAQIRMNPVRDDIIILAVGTNDLVRWEMADAPLEINPAQRQQTWHALLQILPTVTKRVMVLGVLPVAESRIPDTGLASHKIYRCNKDVEAYNAWLHDFVTGAGHVYVDLCTPARAVAWDDYLADAVHPNARGHQFIADQVFDALNKADWV